MTTQTRNYYLNEILTIEGGSAIDSGTERDILRDIVPQAGGSVTLPDTRNSLLNDYLVAKGGSRVDGPQNKIIEAIITQLGGTFDDDLARNPLLAKWEASLIPNVVTYLGEVVTYNGDPVTYTP